MTNVKFYKLNYIPEFTSTHEGLFIHLTANYTVPNSNPEVSYKAGLWFGGHSNWEYLTNDPNAISDAIAALDTESDVVIATADGTNHTVTINGSIKEENGLISDGSANDVILHFASEQGQDNKIITEAEIGSLSGAMHFIDVLTQTEGNTFVQDLTTWKTSHTSYTENSGDVFTWGDKEYVYNGSSFVEFGSVDPTTQVTSLTSGTTTTGLSVTSNTNSVGAVTVNVNAASGYQIPTTTQMTKVDNIAVTLNDNNDGNKVTDGTSTLTHIVSDANYAHITVTSTSVSDGANTFNKYEHPTTTAAAAAAVKVGNDSTGHVVLGDALTASDIARTATSNPSLNGTTVEAALVELAGKITNTNITIDGHKGAITTGDGLTDVDADGGSFAVQIDNNNANGLSVGTNGIAMAKATGSTFGTVEVTAGNGLTLTGGVVAYAHNTTAITIASKDTTTNVVTINGTLTPDASDNITTSNSIALDPLAVTGLVWETTL